MAGLYELSAEYAALLEAIETAESDEQAHEMINALAETEDALEVKAEQYIRIIISKKAEVEGYKAEMDRLRKKCVAAENVVNRLNQVMLDAMKLTGQREIKTTIGKWRIQNNPVSCEITDWEKIPKEYRTPQPDKVDRKGLIDHYKQTGEVFEGVEFTQKEGVRFR